MTVTRPASTTSATRDYPKPTWSRSCMSTRPGCLVSVPSRLSTGVDTLGGVLEEGRLGRKVARGKAIEVYRVVPQNLALCLTRDLVGHELEEVLGRVRIFRVW